ncbi:MAG: TonB-dependent receptor, partial [Polyangiaceae bacterium]
VRVFDLGGMAEAPFADGRGNVMLGGRYSYSAAAFSLLSPGLDIGYWDYQARVHYDITPDDRLSVLAMGAFDYLSQTTDGVEQSLYDVNFHRLDARYDRKFGANRRLRLATTWGRDRSLAADPTATGDVASRGAYDIIALSLRGRAEYSDRLSEGVELRAGADAIFDTSDVALPNRSGTTEFPRFPSRDAKAFGARGDVVFDVGSFLKVVPGVRFDVYRTDGTTVPAIEPRLSARFRVSENVELFHDFGIAHQLPSYIVPIPGFQPELGNGLQRAVQLSSGVGTKWPAGITTTFTLFQNAIFNSTDRLSIAGLRSAEPGIAEDARSLGRTIGAELLIKRDLTRRLGGFIAYTLSRSTRSLGYAHIPAWIDRTHVLNFALGYDLGRHWRLGARVLFYTGVPARVAYVEAAESPPRTPPFYRIDWRLEKRWNLGERRHVSLVFEFLNTTLSREVTRSSCSAFSCKEEIFGPISVPSIGVESMF